MSRRQISFIAATIAGVPEMALYGWAVAVGGGENLRIQSMTKNYVFGLTALALGLALAVGLEDIRRARRGDMHYWLLGSTLLGVAVVGFFWELQLLGTPFLNARDWHVWGEGLGLLLLVPSLVGRFVYLVTPGGKKK